MAGVFSGSTRMWPYVHIHIYMRVCVSACVCLGGNGRLVRVSKAVYKKHTRLLSLELLLMPIVQTYTDADATYIQKSHIVEIIGKYLLVEQLIA